jgi:hypothetical protein
MTLILDLNPEEEARLSLESRRHGTDPATYAKQLVTGNLPGAQPTTKAFEAMLARIARPLPIIPADKQTREYMYED